MSKMRSALFLVGLLVCCSSCRDRATSPESSSSEGQGSPDRRRSLESRKLTPSDVVTFEAAADSDRQYSDPHLGSFRIDRAYLDDVLLRWHIVAKETWLHGYSHVLGGDQTGTITLRAGDQVEWMVKPGGLAWLKFPDESFIHYAKELTSIGIADR